MMSGDLSEMLGTRRLSVPAPMGGGARRYSTLGVPGAGSSLGVPGAGARRLSALVVPGAGPGAGARRLSALVPESVARRLSNVSNSLLGKPHTNDCLVEQGKSLCALYMRSRIRSASGGSSRALACSQLAPAWPGARAVFPRLSQLGRHLERARPRLYAAVGRHAVQDADSGPDAADILYDIGMELFKDDITWGKVVSLMAVCGALASNPRANSDLVGLLEAAAAVIRGPLLTWLTDHGGWYGLVEHCQPLELEVPDQVRKLPSMYMSVTSLALFVLLGLMWLLIRDLLPWLTRT